MISLTQFADKAKMVFAKHGRLLGTGTALTASTMTASAAVDGNWTDGMTAGAAAFSTGVTVFQTAPFSYILGVLVTIIVVLGVAKIIKRFM